VQACDSAREHGSARRGDVPIAWSARTPSLLTVIVRSTCGARGARRRRSADAVETIRTIMVIWAILTVIGVIMLAAQAGSSSGF
jgi:hypothetical protein